MIEFRVNKNNRTSDQQGISHSINVYGRVMFDVNVNVLYEFGYKPKFILFGMK